MHLPRSILLVIDDASVGGGQKHVLALAERLSGRGIAVSVACEAEGYLVDELRKRSIPHHPVHLPEWPSVAGIRELVKMLRTTRAELVHTHGGTAGFYGRLAARRVRGVKTVHTYHGIHYLHQQNFKKRLLHRAIDRFLLRWTNEIICVAESDLQLALVAGLARNGHVNVVYNGIDLGPFDRALGMRSTHEADDAGFCAGTVGRLHEQKGYFVLLQAARAVHAVAPDVHFRIIGEGPQEEELRKKAAALGLGDTVKFLGARNDVPEQLLSFDVFVLSSLWEGLPYVLMEAMAAGLPVVATDVDGVKEMITDGQEGRIVPSRDPQALAAAMLELRRDPALRHAMAKNGMATVKQKFSLDAMIEKTLTVYARAMNS